MSFLDCICCGFGAVILLFVIVNARATHERKELVKNLQGEVNLMELKVLKGKRNQVQVQNTLTEVDEELVRTEGRAREIIERIEELKVELEQRDKTTLASKQHTKKLKSDIKALEEELKRLRAAASEAEEAGTKLREFKGTGDRQYLTGLKVGGEKILILLDCSASMLDAKIVDIIRRRNMPLPARTNGDKWKQTIATIEWLSAQLPPASKFQIYGFNEQAFPLIKESSGKWLNAGSVEDLDAAVKAVHEVVPTGPTSFHSAFDVIQSLDSPPDNIFLLTDGLPTMDTKRPWGNKVSSSKRVRFWNSAQQKLNNRIPVNVILYGLEGDPEAAPAFWQLATRTTGSFFCPAKDWP